MTNVILVTVSIQNLDIVQKSYQAQKRKLLSLEWPAYKHGPWLSPRTWISEGLYHSQYWEERFTMSNLFVQCGSC